jgi:hypothetical protein
MTTCSTQPTLPAYQEGWPDPTVDKHELGSIVRYKVKRGITPRFLAIANSTTVNEIAIIHKQK